MLHMLHAKETGCKMIVVDPRFTRTAAKADEYVRIRSGTDIAVPVRPAAPHLQERLGRQEVHRRPRLRHGQGARGGDGQVDARQGRGSLRRRRGAVLKVAEMMAKNRPSTIVWCMGQTQHTIGNAIVRASCILQLALGNIGVSRRRRQHLPRPRQRAGRDRRRPEPRFAARLLRPRRRLVEALRQGLGRRLRVDQEAVRARA